MKPIDHQLNRLFHAAQNVPAPEIAPAFGLETRVLAAWREGSAAPASFWDMAVLTRGLVLAGVIMAACFLPALTTSSSSNSVFAEVMQSSDTTVDSNTYP
jgi:hypothetical protein